MTDIQKPRELAPITVTTNSREALAHAEQLYRAHPGKGP